MAQTYNLGQVAIISRGAYAAGTAYVPLNVVTHRSGSFMCITACTGIEPAVASSWRTYWVPTAIGIYSAVVTAPSDTTAKLTLTFSDGTTYEHTYGTTGVADGSVTNSSLGEAISIAKGGTGATTAAAALTALGAQSKILECQVAISGSASSWTVTKDVNNNSLSDKVKSNSIIVIGPEQTVANAQNYGNYFIVLSGQSNGTLNFTSRDTVPSGTTITINVMIVNV